MRVLLVLRFIVPQCCRGTWFQVPYMMPIGFAKTNIIKEISETTWELVEVYIVKNNDTLLQYS
jgi:hypothetical protein